MLPFLICGIGRDQYRQVPKNVEAERQACEIRLRAERKCGQLLREREMRAGRPKEKPSNDLIIAEGAGTLAELGISRNQSSQWQQLAAIPDDEFEQAVVQPRASPPSYQRINHHRRRSTHAALSCASLQRSRCGRASSVGNF